MRHVGDVVIGPSGHPAGRGQGGDNQRRRQGPPALRQERRRGEGPAQGEPQGRRRRLAYRRAAPPQIEIAGEDGERRPQTSVQEPTAEEEVKDASEGKEIEVEDASEEEVEDSTEDISMRGPRSAQTLVQGRPLYTVREHRA